VRCAQAVHLIVAQAVKPAEPRFISAFFFRGADFPTDGRKASACLSRGIFTGACHTRSNVGQAFVWMDRYLDSASGGPRYLKQRPIAQLVVDSLH
jgi:hypothetical protein